MNQDLLDIRDLFKVDQEMDALRVEAAALAAAVREAQALVQTQNEALVVRESERVAAVTEERVLSRRLDDYTRRRDKTSELIDSGRAPDYLAAQKQLEQCAAIVDDLEYKLLEQMDARECADAAVAGAKRAIVDANANLNAASDAQRERRPQIEDRYKLLSPDRKRRWASIGNHYHSRYEGLRRKELSVVIWLRDGSCEQCHLQAAPQIAIEVGQGKRVHNCRGCGGFFFDSRESEDASDDA